MKELNISYLLTFMFFSFVLKENTNKIVIYREMSTLHNNNWVERYSIRILIIYAKRHFSFKYHVIEVLSNVYNFCHSVRRKNFRLKYFLLISTIKFVHLYMGFLDELFACVYVTDLLETILNLWKWKQLYVVIAYLTLIW